MSVLSWIFTASFVGGILSMLCVAVFALNVRAHWIGALVSYAIGALLGAVFLDILPEAIKLSPNSTTVSATVLFGILLFFTLEKVLIWRHCHHDHCEVHEPNGHGNSSTPKNETRDARFHLPNPDELTSHLTKLQKTQQVIGYPPVVEGAIESLREFHLIEQVAHDHGRSGSMVIVGDTFHNFIDGIIIAAAFLTDIHLGVVTSLAIIAHEIPQEVGDFAILLHSGYSKLRAFQMNLISSFATVVGGVLGYLTLQTMQSWTPKLLALAAASLIYVAVADLIPGLHKRTKLSDTIQQVVLIVLGVGTVALMNSLIAE